MTLLVATTNEGKLREIRAMLASLPLTLDTLAKHPGLQEPEETGHTFSENAKLKARYYAARTGQICVSEDSGLEIDELDGAPGVQSSRFNGASYSEKFSAIYAELKRQKVASSDARFVCALAVANGAEIIFEALGMVEGRIAKAPRGETGFGYDPIFFYPPYGLTLAEVTAEKKAAVSHRGKAFLALRAFLESSFPRP